MGCADKEDPPFPNGAITLDALKDACRVYDSVEDYNKALNEFRAAREFDVKVDESHHNIDLGEKQQVQQLVALFLNKWQCRLPNPESKVVKPKNRPVVSSRFDEMQAGLQVWWERYAKSLPSASLRLATAHDRDIEACLELFEWRSEVKVTRNRADKRKYFGDVAASKTLYVMRPHFFVPWDNAILRTLGHTDGCGRLYVRYLKRVRDRLKELDKDFGESDVPGSGLAWLLNEIPGQGSCTPAELMNKLYWATVPRKKRRSR